MDSVHQSSGQSVGVQHGSALLQILISIEISRTVSFDDGTAGGEDDASVLPVEADDGRQPYCGPGADAIWHRGQRGGGVAGL